MIVNIIYDVVIVVCLLTINFGLVSNNCINKTWPKKYYVIPEKSFRNVLCFKTLYKIGSTSNFFKYYIKLIPRIIRNFYN